MGPEKRVPSSEACGLRMCCSMRRTFTRLLVLLLALMSGCHSSPANGQQQRSESHQQAQNADSGPCPPPLVCTPVSSGVGQPPTKTHNGPAENKPQSVRQKIWQNVLKAFAPELWVNWALAVFAALAAFLALRTLKAIVVQARANNISANAATETVRIMHNTADRQLRAYVFPISAQRV